MSVLLHIHGRRFLGRCVVHSQVDSNTHHTMRSGRAMWDQRSLLYETVSVSSGWTAGQSQSDGRRRRISVALIDTIE